jgi:hypothetical protein
MSDPAQHRPALHEIVDPCAPDPPPRLDPLIVDPWERLGDAGLDEHQAGAQKE